MNSAQVIPIRRGATISGLGQDTTGSEFTDILSQVTEAATDVAGAYLQYRTQSDLIDLNIARAQQGLAPISPQQVAPAVNVGVTSQTQNTMLIIAAVIAGALILPQLMKRR